MSSTEDIKSREIIKENRRRRYPEKQKEKGVNRDSEKEKQRKTLKETDQRLHTDSNEF